MSSDDFKPYPKAPDLKRVRELRGRLRTDKAETVGTPSSGVRKAGRAARDIGSYTLIPSLMIAGPVVGYVLGHLVEKYLGGAPWGGVIGLLVGVVAAFREVFLLLKRKSEADYRVE